MFSEFVRAASSKCLTLTQPRMGWGDPARMRAALLAVKALSSRCIGTLTLDSYTRVGDYDSPLKRLLEGGEDINGYPIVSHSAAQTREVLRNVYDATFPVQVRHGCAQPQRIFQRMLEVGLGATEGGPVSYCLPYGRIPLAVSIRAWSESCRILADGTEYGHIESFGGCLLGQLCPPSLLIAMGIIECLFFEEHGIRSVSLSYAQGPSYVQDRAALAVLRDMADKFLGRLEWHRVVYTYMGMFPATEAGAMLLIEDSARLARTSACERLIVKTKAERLRIPSIDDNLQAIRCALAVTAQKTIDTTLSTEEQECYDVLREQTLALLECVLNLSPRISEAILRAFSLGLLDVPFCLHPDNAGKTQAIIDGKGHLQWSGTGGLPFRSEHRVHAREISSRELLIELAYVADRYDRRAGEDQHSSRMSYAKESLI